MPEFELSVISKSLIMFGLIFSSARAGHRRLLLNAHEAIYLTHPFVRELPS
jgi:hypothetical protein